MTCLTVKDINSKIELFDNYSYSNESLKSTIESLILNQKEIMKEIQFLKCKKPEYDHLNEKDSNGITTQIHQENNISSYLKELSKYSTKEPFVFSQNKSSNMRNTTPLMGKESQIKDRDITKRIESHENDIKNLFSINKSWIEKPIFNKENNNNDVINNDSIVIINNNFDDPEDEHTIPLPKNQQSKNKLNNINDNDIDPQFNQKNNTISTIKEENEETKRFSNGNNYSPTDHITQDIIDMKIHIKKIQKHLSTLSSKSKYDNIVKEIHHIKQDLNKKCQVTQYLEIVNVIDGILNKINHGNTRGSILKDDSIYLDTKTFDQYKESINNKLHSVVNFIYKNKRAIDSLFDYYKEITNTRGIKEQGNRNRSQSQHGKMNNENMRQTIQRKINMIPRRRLFNQQQSNEDKIIEKNNSIKIPAYLLDSNAFEKDSNK